MQMYLGSLFDEMLPMSNSQYIDTFEYSINVRIVTQRHGIPKTDNPSCDKHFQYPGHKFNEPGKFTIV